MRKPDNWFRLPAAQPNINFWFWHRCNPAKIAYRSLSWFLANNPIIFSIVFAAHSTIRKDRQSALFVPQFESF